jgi:hypothetical protein
MRSNTEIDGGDAVSAELTAVLARLGELADGPVEDPAVPGAVRIDRIAVLERMRAALAAAQHTEMVAFGRSQVEEQSALSRARAGGPTSFTNGRGVCARGNFVREMPGWQIHTVHEGLGDQPHTVRTTTPTGHTYTSRAGP